MENPQVVSLLGKKLEEPLREMDSEIHFRWRTEAHPSSWNRFHFIVISARKAEMSRFQDCLVCVFFRAESEWFQRWEHWWFNLIVYLVQEVWKQRVFFQKKGWRWDFDDLIHFLKCYSLYFVF